MPVCPVLTGPCAARPAAEVTGQDPGRGHRQLAALDARGGTRHFTGRESIPACGAAEAEQVVAAGNLLNAEAVLAGFAEATGTFSERLLAALRAGHVEQPGPSMAALPAGHEG